MKALPSDLATRPFSTREARSRGMLPQHLRDKELHTVTRGSRVRAEPTTLVDRALAFMVAMHGPVALSHVTAALLWELPLPAAVERQVDLDVICGRGAGPVRRNGCIGHRGLERRRVVQHRSGVTVTSLADTWVDLGEVLGRGLDLDDLVVAGDVAARHLDDVHGKGEGRSLIRGALEARVRPRGKVLLSEALTLLSPRSKSPMETRARLMFHRGGLPAPELNVQVTFDGGDGVDGGGGGGGGGAVEPARIRRLLGGAGALWAATILIDAAAMTATAGKIPSFTLSLLLLRLVCA